MSLTVDEIALLLSSDWFFDHWSSIGIHLGEQERKKVQLEARSIVGDILPHSGIFWDANFSKERLSRVKVELDRVIGNDSLEALMTAGQGGTSIVKHNGLVFLVDGQLLKTMLLLLMQDGKTAKRSGVVDESIVCRVTQLLGEIDGLEFPAEVDIGRTDWDKLLVACTPGQPDYIYNFALMLIEKSAFVDKAWRAIANRLNNEEVDSVIKFVNEKSKLLAGREVFQLQI